MLHVLNAPLTSRVEIEELAACFPPVSLAEMEAVRLMNRVDRKFLIPFQQFPNLLKQLLGDYRWLQVDGYPLCPYETLYFDTPEFQLYHAHQTGRANRCKIRQRTYVQSNLRFTEVKVKTNKGRTIKNRIQMPIVEPSGQLSPLCRDFVLRHTAIDPVQLQPILQVNYTRITLVSRTTAERLTFDLDLSFQQRQQCQAYPALVIAELKQDALQTSLFLTLMKRFQIRQGSVSKYCLGLISLNPVLKHNRFKTQLARINKIIDPL